MATSNGAVDDWRLVFRIGWEGGGIIRHREREGASFDTGRGRLLGRDISEGDAKRIVRW